MAPLKPLRRFDFAIIFATLAIFAANLPLAGAATTIRVGYPQLNGGQTPLWNIADSKIDQKYNLDIKPVYIPGGVRLTQSMLSGAVDIAMTGGAAVNAMLSGAEFIYVGMPVAKPMKKAGISSVRSKGTLLLNDPPRTSLTMDAPKLCL